MSDSVSVVVSKPEKVGGIRKKYDTSKNKSSYSSKSLPYDKRNIERNTQSQVTAFRKSYKEVSPIAQMMVDQILDPEVVSSAVRFPTYGVSALYPAKNVAQCRYDANGRSSVIVSPMLRNAILATTGATFDQTLKASGTADHPYGRQTLNILPSDGEVSFSSPIFFDNGHAIASCPNSDTGRQLFALSTTGAGSATGQLLVQLGDVHAATQIRVTIWRYDSSFALISSASTTTSASGLATITLIPVAAVLTRYIAITIACQGTIPYQGPAVVSMIDSAAAMVIQIANVSQHYLTQDLNGSATIYASAEEFVVTSQSLLLTFEGSSLQDGGVMAIARVPSGTLIGENSGVVCDNYYDYISSLSRNSYNGPVKTGGYAFYLGQDERSYFYRPIDQFQAPDLPYLVAEWTSEGSPVQPIRIQVQTIVQFVTNNNIYDQRPSDYLGEDYCKILHIMSNITAAYDNPDHKGLLRQALSKASSGVMKLLKNPKTYTSAYDMAKMVTGLIPGIDLPDRRGLGGDNYLTSYLKKR